MTQKPYLPGIWRFIGLALTLVIGIMLIGQPRNPYNWILLVVVGLVIALTFIKRNINPADAYNAKSERSTMYKIFFYGVCAIIIILVLVGMWGFYALQDSGLQKSAFHSVALAIIILWACVFLGYFIWGVYFYNINLGITEEEWEKIESNKLKRSRGEYFSEEEISSEPTYNPYKDQTFGLPPGTVRGMIAFTLLFGSISMLIMSIGTTECPECESILRDQYEFFKTAFLMMIAFYFGSKTLEEFNKGDKGGAAPSPVLPVPPSGPTLQGVPLNPAETPGAGPVEQINPMKPEAPSPDATPSASTIPTSPPAPTAPAAGSSTTTSPGTSAPTSNEVIKTINPMGL